MEHVTDGGPVHPVGEFLEQNGERNYYGERGISLRDHFAGLAMQGFVQQGIVLMDEAIAENAYALADALLKAREK